MFKVSFPEEGKNYTVEFSYGEKEVQFFSKGKLVTAKLPTTTAHLIDTTELETWTHDDAVKTATVACATNDNFNRNTGRKEALAKVLKEFTSDRNVRRMFWFHYSQNVAWKNWFEVVFPE